MDHLLKKLPNLSAEKLSLPRSGHKKSISNMRDLDSIATDLHPSHPPEASGCRQTIRRMLAFDTHRGDAQTPPPLKLSVDVTISIDSDDDTLVSGLTDPTPEDDYGEHFNDAEKLWAKEDDLPLKNVRADTPQSILVSQKILAHIPGFEDEDEDSKPASSESGARTTSKTPATDRSSKKLPYLHTPSASTPNHTTQKYKEHTAPRPRPPSYYWGLRSAPLNGPVERSEITSGALSACETSLSPPPWHRERRRKDALLFRDA